MELRKLLETSILDYRTVDQFEGVVLVAVESKAEAWDVES